ncbi:MAG: methyltransferase [Methanothrix sp.]|uniref:methyltransferase n=1 Tax=Methanothrix sp. TaxID=90426 RepID=UPI00247DC223|nr:methyltransferase [Methanothrix sp.]
MLEAMDLLVEEGLRDDREPLRSVGSPMTEIGYPLPYPPRLGDSQLILLMDRVNRTAASRLLEIPEVKGVIRRSRHIPGVVDKKGHTWELLSGCDMRCDVIQSIYGDLVIYKNQSKIHVEFPRENYPKIRILEDLRIVGRSVVDGLCGPGTLGLVCALAGAKRVVMNDIWLPAIENVLINLEANRDILGIDSIEIFNRGEKQVQVGSIPRLVGRARGACEIEVYHGDVRKLFSAVSPSDICILDHFPGAPLDDIRRACSPCGEIVVI